MLNDKEISAIEAVLTQNTDIVNLLIDRGIPPRDIRELCDQARFEKKLVTKPEQVCLNCRHYWKRKGACVKAPGEDGDDKRYWSEPSHQPRWCPGFELDPHSHNDTEEV